MNSEPRDIRHGPTRFTEYDIFLFKEGNNFRLYEKLGAHIGISDGEPGTYFAVWAPNAASVSVIGDFNSWTPGRHPLAPRWDESGIWEGFLPGAGRGTLYKYHIRPRRAKKGVDKGDPFALFWEPPPRTASIVWDLAYSWEDADWMKRRREANDLRSPVSIYEVHLGSWRRDPQNPGRFLSYGEIGPELSAYVKDMGFTHVEFLPVMEHPFYGSWGYQTTGYFAPTSRYGTPQDFMALIDHLHQNEIGVLLDWVPSHFPSDEYGLAFFDGTHLFEHADPKKGFHPDWKSLIFNYGRNEVRSFLFSSALFWLDVYHAEGLRVDAVASMLYLDYSRKTGEWIPNEYGGRENLDAIVFIKRLNEIVYERFPDVQTMAEESTAWPMVTRPVSHGGLGFGLKWNLGWMHDILDYMTREPIHRKHHHHQLTFGIWYAFYENFLLPLSHDEVVHGKGSLLEKMPGDDWQKFAGLRLLLAFQFTHPGKKLLFMGGEFGQRREWSHENSQDWHLLERPSHSGIKSWVRDLNRVYRTAPALFEKDFEPEGFEWIDFGDWENSVVSFLRKGRSPSERMVAVFNFTPVVRTAYRIGVPGGGYWEEVLNSDAESYGGSGRGNAGGLKAEPLSHHGRSHSLSLTLPPLAMLLLRMRSESP